MIKGYWVLRVGPGRLSASQSAQRRKSTCPELFAKSILDTLGTSGTSGGGGGAVILPGARGHRTDVRSEPEVRFLSCPHARESTTRRLAQSPQLEHQNLEGGIASLSLPPLFEDSDNRSARIYTRQKAPTPMNPKPLTLDHETINLVILASYSP